MATTYSPTKPGTLVTRREVGEILGVKRQRVHQLVGTAGFPDPIDVCWDGELPIWRRVDVVKWQEARIEAAAARKVPASTSP